MSGTKSPSQKAPATSALIVAHGQPSAPAPPEAELAELAQRVQALLPDWQVRSATLAMPEAVATAASDLPAGSLVYPFFMANGWFVRQALPKKLGRADLQIAMPYGLDPALPRLAAQIVSTALREQGWQPAQSRLLLAAHGSARSDYAAQAAASFFQALQRLLPTLTITLGYVEQSPFLAEAAKGSPQQTLCLPFFARAGEHVRDDIPNALQQGNFAGILLPALGLDAQTAQLIADALSDTQKETTT